jgi:microsomal dipeptidase-like Zn-dependent dipeptidase
MRLLLFFCLCPLLLFAQNEEVHEYMDLQIHPTMHIPYGFFGEFKYFEEGEEPKLKYKHSFKNVIYANYLRENKGLRIIVNGALTNEKIRSKKKARRLIVEQIELMDQFAADHPEDFVVARTPQEVRDLVKNTDKTIIIHSIEGARKVINSKEDAEFYASKGVAFVTLIHLTDYKYGGAAIKPAFVTKLINFKGLFRKKRKRGLTEKGKEAILWLANAGIITDITHMSDQTRIDALAFMEEKGLKPLSTHDGFKPIQNHPRGIDTASVLKIYKLGGLMSLPISGESLKAHNIQEPYKSMLDSLEKAGCHCEGSIDSYRFTYEALKDYIHQHSSYFYGDSLYQYKDLPDSAKTQLAIGFQTDFNGWLNHHRPKVGKKGCYKLEAGKDYEQIEIDGMPHPGYMESHWRWLEKEGVDLDPVRRSSEKFLQMWEYYLDKKGSF